MDARELMTPNPYVLTGCEPVSHAARLMRELDVGMLPVVDDEARRHARGVITDRDIVLRCVAERASFERPVEEFMTPGPLKSVPPDADVQEVMQRMARERLRRLLVVENGRLVGVIAQADLALRQGPRDPLRVEQVLEGISEPGRPPG